MKTDTLKQVLNLITDNPSSREEVYQSFPKEDQGKVHQAINKLLINDKIICRDGIFEKAKKSKYGNKRVEIDGIKFMSVAEGDRYVELKQLEKTGSISNLQLQIPFVIADAVKWNGKKIAAKKYVADFVYQEDGKTVVEDRKGARTALYVLKRSLFIARYPDMEFRES